MKNLYKLEVKDFAIRKIFAKLSFCYKNGGCKLATAAMRVVI